MSEKKNNYVSCPLCGEEDFDAVEEEERRIVRAAGIPVVEVKP